MEELLDIQSEMMYHAQNNYFRMETLRGYCANAEDEKVSSVMIETLLAEICLNQKNMIKLIDSGLTHYAHQLYLKYAQIND